MEACFMGPVDGARCYACGGDAGGEVATAPSRLGKSIQTAQRRPPQPGQRARRGIGPASGIPRRRPYMRRPRSASCYSVQGGICPPDWGSTSWRMPFACVRAWRTRLSRRHRHHAGRAKRASSVIASISQVRQRRPIGHGRHIPGSGRRCATGCNPRSYPLDCSISSAIFSAVLAPRST